MPIFNDDRQDGEASNQANDAPLNTVLVAEDHDDTRFMLRTVLEMNRFEVIEAVSGVDAVLLARRHRPDVVLMDYTLPLLDGIAATKMIREYKLTQDVPIIFLSGRAEPEPQLAALKAGCNDYLVKPVDLEGMLKVIRRSLSEPPRSDDAAKQIGDGNYGTRNIGTF